MSKSPFIEQLRIQNFGCIGDLALELTRLHAFIGPNDSGKSTVLNALATLGALVSERAADRITDHFQQLVALLRDSAKGGDVALQATAAGRSFRVSMSPNGECYESAFPTNGGDVTTEPRRLELGTGARLLAKDAGPLAEALGGALRLRLDPDALRKATPLIPEGQPVRLSDDRGTGLPGIYDAIRDRDAAAFTAINAQVTALFPTVKNLSLKNPSQGTKTLGVQLRSGKYISAEHMSEGLLYFLAFAALPFVEPAAIILVEEPENGLHPARIRQVMDVLRRVSEHTQVVIATHSPLVINELDGGEVTVLTRSTEQGVSARLLKDTPDFEERSKVYALGELWVSYANGDDEAPLVQGGPRP